MLKGFAMIMKTLSKILVISSIVDLVIFDNDIYLEVPCTITDLCLGCKKTIKTIDGKVDLKIKEGTQPGEMLRIKGKGINNPDSWRKGDFYCVIKLVIPTSLSRKQKSILKDLEDTDLDDETVFKNFNKLNK